MSAELKLPEGTLGQLRVGERLRLPTVPSPWCNFEYEVTKIRKETVSLRVVR